VDIVIAFYISITSEAGVDMSVLYLHPINRFGI
jgi:hypothetical protein